MPQLDPYLWVMIVGLAFIVLKHGYFIFNGVDWIRFNTDSKDKEDEALPNPPLPPDPLSSIEIMRGEYLAAKAAAEKAAQNLVDVMNRYDQALSDYDKLIDDARAELQKMPKPLLPQPDPPPDPPQSVVSGAARKEG